MDHLIDNDTQALHWVLNEQQTNRFLAAFFSDPRVFNKDAFPTSQLDAVVPTISSVFHSLPSAIYATNRFTLPTQTRVTEAVMSEFFNTILQHVISRQPNIHSVYKKRVWTGDGANRGLAGCDATRKPDLILCREPVSGKKIDMRVDVLSIGEMKSSEKAEKSFTELAGKVAFIHQAQEGRYATPCLRVLGEDVVFTMFDRGGSISTHPINMHQSPELFLRILLGITFAPRMTLGFDLTAHEVRNRTRDIEVTLLDGTKGTINATELLFISGSLHGRGTTVWSGRFNWSGVEKEVVVKDCFIDPLRRYTEGKFLAMLNDAKIAGVPELITEHLVQTEHPITKETITNSTHILRALLGVPQDKLRYQLRVLSRLVTMPRGYPIFEFSSLAELLVGFLDCITSHRDALEIAKIIHRDVSLFNLLFAPGTRRLLLEDILRNLPQKGSECGENSRKTLDGLIEKWRPRRGLLADWGYAAPTPDHPDFFPSDDSLPSTSSSPSQPEVPPTHTAELESLQGSIDSVLVKREDRVLFAPLQELKSTDNIVIPMARDTLPKTVCDANDKLHRTGTWPWMATELSHIGPGQPLDHKPAHDLESFFYVLLGVCLLFDEPKSPKSDDQLATSFDPLFAVFKPTVQKTLVIQSEYGWTTLILANISPYFGPIIPLLNIIRTELILCIKTNSDGRFASNSSFTHSAFISALARTIVELPPSHWENRGDRNSGSNESAVLLSSESRSMPGPPLYTSQLVATTSSSASLPTPKSHQQLDLPPMSSIVAAKKRSPQFDDRGASSSLPSLILPNVSDSPPPSPSIPPSPDILPRPNTILRLGKPSGGSSSSKGIDNSFPHKSSSGSKRGATEPQAESRPSKKRQTSNLSAQSDDQSSGVPRYQERGGGRMSRLHGHTTPF